MVVKDIDKITERMLFVLAQHMPYQFSEIKAAYMRLDSVDATRLAIDVAGRSNISLGEAVAIMKLVKELDRRQGYGG